MKKHQLSFPKHKCCVHTQQTSTRLHYPKFPLKTQSAITRQTRKKNKISHLHFELKRSQEDSLTWLQGCVLQLSQEFLGNTYMDNGARSKDQPTSQGKMASTGFRLCGTSVIAHCKWTRSTVAASAAQQELIGTAKHLGTEDTVCTLQGFTSGQIWSHRLYFQQQFYHIFQFRFVLKDEVYGDGQ